MQVYLVVSCLDGSNVDVKSSLHRAQAVAHNMNERSGGQVYLVQKCIIKLTSAQASKYMLTRSIKFYLAVLYNGISVTCAAFSTHEETESYIHRQSLKEGNWLIEEWEFKKDMNEEDKKEFGLMEEQEKSSSTNLN